MSSFLKGDLMNKIGKHFTKRVVDEEVKEKPLYVVWMENIILTVVVLSVPFYFFPFKILPWFLQLIGVM